jgi:uncharacterized protein YjbI with pentapeptide repeats
VNFGHAQCQGVNFSGAQCQEADFESTQCQGAYALKKFYSQELSSRIGKETKFEVLRLEGEIVVFYLIVLIFSSLSLMA